MAIALVAGTTGLIGSQLVDLLINDKFYDRIIALSRKPVEPTHAKVQNMVVDFDLLAQQANHLKADDVFCCLGTTIRQAGSQEAFRKVDLEYPVNLARVAHANGARQYLIVTALGSDPTSSIFYNRVKGEVEKAVAEVGYECLHIFQPSMLLGERKEQRAGESVGKTVMRVLDFVIPRKYKAIESAKVARAMVAVARKRQAGTHVHSSGEMQEF